MTSAQWQEEVHGLMWEALLRDKVGDIGGLRVSRGFADVRWEERPTMGGDRELVPWLCVRVEENWLATVARDGLVMVESELILAAQPASPVNKPEGCDGCWTALASRWHLGKNGPRRSRASGPGPYLTFVVKYGGLAVLCPSPEVGMDGLLRKVERGLGI